jgi:hypothetical protein
MTEREAFEAWAKKAGWPHHFTSCNTKDPTAYSQESWEVWQAARAQPAQVLQGQCAECGKKASEGWALYCVACMEEAGLPAQAVPLLTDKERRELLDHTGRNAEGLGGETWDQMVIDAVEAAVRAKMGVAVPMTDAQINDAYGEAGVQHDHIPHDDVVRIARAVERHHGIVGKEGA